MRYNDNKNRLDGTAAGWDVTEWDADGAAKKRVQVPAEVPVELRVNDVPLAVLHCTPEHIEELATGYLLGQGLAGACSEILSLEVEPGQGAVHIRLENDLDIAALVRRGRVTVFSGCGQSVDPVTPAGGEALAALLSSRAAFDAFVVRQTLSRLLTRGELYGRTHGVHSAAIVSSEGQIMALREDIGRHNALDKVLGWTALRGLDPARLFVAATGRISADAVAKLIRFGLPLMVTRGVPTSMALGMAEESGITLAGSLGPGRLRIYTHARRLGGPS